MNEHKTILSGNEAIARGAYEWGVTFAAAYPGTPSTEITQEFSRYDGVYAEWSPNEKVALEVAIGAAFAGADAMAVMKHVGVNVAADPLFTVSYTGTNGGLVLVVADDPSMHSSQNEQDSRNYAAFAKVPMLEPADSEEARQYIKTAFALSRDFDTPVFLRSTTRLSHSKSVVTLEEPRKRVDGRNVVKNSAKYVMVPAMARKRRIVVEDRLKKLQVFAESFDGNRMELNSMTKFDSVWFSDNQNPFEGTRIFADTILRMPPSCIEKWCAIRNVDGFTPIYAKDYETERLVTVSGATWAGIESVSMNYIKMFATGGPLGITCNLSEIGEKTFNQLKEYVSEFKQMRELYKQTACRPLAISDSFTVLQYNDEEETIIVLQAFEKKANQAEITIYPKLKKDKRYVYDNAVYTSEELQKDGVEIDIFHAASYSERCGMLVLREKEQ